MLFDHEELFHRLCSDSKLKGCADSWQFEEVRSEMVLYEASGVGWLFADLWFGFFYLEKDLIGVCISDLEKGELDVEDIVFNGAEEVFGWWG